MASMQIDDELHKKVKEYIETDRIEYPSIQNFVEKSIRNQLRIEYINKKENE